MKISTKTSIILLSILFLGIIIGVLGSGILHQKRFEKIQRMDSGQRFTEALFCIIKPDKTQRQIIADILKNQTQKIALLEEEYQNEIFTVFDSTRLEIKSLLSEEQLKQLENKMDKGQDHILSRRIKHLDKLLHLSDKQREQIEQIMKESAPNFASSKHPFFMEDRKSRANIRQIKEKMGKVIEAILTPEQIEIYRESRKHRTRHMSKSFKPPSDEK